MSTLPLEASAKAALQCLLVGQSGDGRVLNTHACQVADRDLGIVGPPGMAPRGEFTKFHYGIALGDEPALEAVMEFASLEALCLKVTDQQIGVAQYFTLQFLLEG